MQLGKNQANYSAVENDSNSLWNSRWTFFVSNRVTVSLKRINAGSGINSL